jgi:hypothetical protein
LFARILLAMAMLGAWVAITLQYANAQNVLSDDEIVAIVVKQSREAYYATGHPCACPDDLAGNGSRCGRRSAYIRPGGAAPYCYISDVSKAKLEEYRANMGAR